MRAETPPRFQIPRVSFSGGANATFFHFCCFIRTSTSNSKLNLLISKAKMQSKAYNAVFCTLCDRLSGSSAKCKLNLTHFPFGSKKAKFSGAKIAKGTCTTYTKISAKFLHLCQQTKPWHFTFSLLFRAACPSFSRTGTIPLKAKSALPFSLPHLSPRAFSLSGFSGGFDLLPVVFLLIFHTVSGDISFRAARPQKKSVNFQKGLDKMFLP